MSMLQIFDSQNYIVGDGDKNNHGTAFINKSAGNGGAVFCSARSLIINATILAANNMADDPYVFYIGLSSGQISGSLTFINNRESLLLFSSNIVADANGKFINNTISGAILILQSTLYLNGSFYLLEHNSRVNGGAIYATESKLYINAPIRIENNKATENGGGLYLYQSEISCGQNCHLIIQGNEAAKSGEGIHAISSLIMLSAPLLSTQAKWIELIENTAEKGGGIMLESNAKLYTMEISIDIAFPTI